MRRIPDPSPCCILIANEGAGDIAGDENKGRERKEEEREEDERGIPSEVEEVGSAAVEHCEGRRCSEVCLQGPRYAGYIEVDVSSLMFTVDQRRADVFRKGDWATWVVFANPMAGKK